MFTSRRTARARTVRDRRRAQPIRSPRIVEIRVHRKRPLAFVFEPLIEQRLTTNGRGENSKTPRTNQFGPTHTTIGLTTDIQRRYLK